MLDKIKELIRPTDRIIMARRDILPLKFPVKQSEEISMFSKPNGLWYAIGTEWIDWVESEMPEWEGSVIYKLEINEPSMILIRNGYELEKFTNVYGVPVEHIITINWGKVAHDFSGIEIAPYQHTLRFKHRWYYGWDVASGCIWDKKGIVSINKLVAPQ